MAGVSVMTCRRLPGHILRRKLPGMAAQPTRQPGVTSRAGLSYAGASQVLRPPGRLHGAGRGMRTADCGLRTDQRRLMGEQVGHQGPDLNIAVVTQAAGEPRPMLRQEVTPADG